CCSLRSRSTSARSRTRATPSCVPSRARSSWATSAHSASGSSRFCRRHFVRSASSSWCSSWSARFSSLPRPERGCARPASASPATSPLLSSSRVSVSSSSRSRPPSVLSPNSQWPSSLSGARRSLACCGACSTPGSSSSVCRMSAAKMAETKNDAFPHGAARFLGQLRRNNRKDWFDVHREEYERFVLELGAGLRKLRPKLQVDPRTNYGVKRINRDVRFARDKRPYKDHQTLWWWEGAAKDPAPGYWFDLTPTRVYLGVGWYMIEPA